MLLTVPDRRQAIANLRLRGTTRAGDRAGGSVPGDVPGRLCLARRARSPATSCPSASFTSRSAYLAEAFTLGSNTVVGTAALLLAFLGGVLATCVASAIVLLDLRRSRTRDAVYQQDGVPGDALAPSVRRRLFAGSVGLLAAASVLYALAPSAAIAATALLALATVLAVPLVLGEVLSLMAPWPSATSG